MVSQQKEPTNQPNSKLTNRHNTTKHQTNTITITTSIHTTGMVVVVVNLKGYGGR